MKDMSHEVNVRFLGLKRIDSSDENVSKYVFDFCYKRVILFNFSSNLFISSHQYSSVQLIFSYSENFLTIV